MIYLGADHAGFEAKEDLKVFLDKNKYEYKDLGSFKIDLKDDYPDYGSKVAKTVSLKVKNNKGILICGSALGMGMVANKYKDVRAAVVSDVKNAKLSRLHNDANVLCLSGWQLSKLEIEKIVKVWLNTKFTREARHKHRLNKMKKIEKDNFK